jgi:hypothetical protein
MLSTRHFGRQQQLPLASGFPYHPPNPPGPAPLTVRTIVLCIKRAALLAESCIAHQAFCSWAGCPRRCDCEAPTGPTRAAGLPCPPEGLACVVAVEQKGGAIAEAILAARQLALALVRVVYDAAFTAYGSGRGRAGWAGRLAGGFYVLQRGGSTMWIK